MLHLLYIKKNLQLCKDKMAETLPGAEHDDCEHEAFRKTKF